MKKIINTFKYGDKKVKRSLALAILSGVMTLVFAGMALVFANMLCFFVAIVAGFITISMVQTFMIAEGENPTIAAPVSQMEEISFENRDSEKKASGMKNKIKRKKAEKIKVEKKSAKSGKKVEYIEDESRETEDIKIKKTKKIKKSKIHAHDIDEEKLDMANLLNQPDTSEAVQESYEKEEQTLEDDTTKKRYKVITEATAETYTRKKIKRTLHKYKVIKDHRMVIVDRSDRYRINQTPAYVWVQENQFHILLIEEEPRLLMIPIFRITEISHLKKQPVDEKKDYSIFNKSTILTESFRPYLPDYNHSNKTTDLTAYKNLYGITQGIYFTNNSAKNLFDLLGVDFYVEDKVTTSNKVNIFFKEAYKANIKLRDNVLDANGYADSITKILDDMAHSNISYAEFKDTLNLMTKNKLITDEYANHYMDVRNRVFG